MSGFEPVAKDPDGVRLRVRLDCLTCSDFNEVGRVYDGPERGDLVIRGRGRALHITDKVRLIPGAGPVYRPKQPEDYSPHYPTAAVVKAAPFQTFPVRRAQVPGLLLELYCPTRRMLRVQGTLGGLSPSQSNAPSTTMQRGMAEALSLESRAASSVTASF